jgi:hypothetical protein
MRTFGQSGAVGIWLTLRQTSRRLLRRPKPTKARIASLMSVAAAVLCVPQSAHSEQVAVAIQGIVQEGTDRTGAFGEPKSNLAGEPFTLTFTIDSTKGANATSPATGVPSSSSIVTSSAGNPVTGALTIKGRTADFDMLGTLPISSISSKASRTVNGIPSAYFNINEANYADNTEGTDQIVITVYLPNLPTTDYEWQSPIYYTFPENGPANGSFAFDHWKTNSSYTTIVDEQAASGRLIVTSISVSPGVFSASAKAFSASVGQYFSTASNVIALAFLARDVKSFVVKAQSRLYFQIVMDAASQNHEIFVPIELSVGLNNAARQATSDGGGGQDPVSATLDFIAWMANSIALDPPDWNYKTVEPPQSLSLPTSGNATVDHVINDYLTATSLEAASLHALERWQAATIANDTTSATLQLNAYNTYSAQAASAEAVLSQDNLALISVLPPVPVSSFPGGATAMAAAFNALCDQPLPSSLNTSLEVDPENETAG